MKHKLIFKADDDCIYCYDRFCTFLIAFPLVHVRLSASQSRRKSQTKANKAIKVNSKYSEKTALDFQLNLSVTDKTMDAQAQRRV